MILGVPEVSTVTPDGNIQAFRWGAPAREDRAQRHREVSRVRRGDQLFWTGLALALTESRCECDREASESTATSGGHASAASDRPAPRDRGRSLDVRHRCTPFPRCAFTGLEVRARGRWCRHCQRPSSVLGSGNLVSPGNSGRRQPPGVVRSGASAGRRGDRCYSSQAPPRITKRPSSSFASRHAWISCGVTRR